MRKRDLHVIERNLVKMRGRLLENLQRMEEDSIRVPPPVANGDPGTSQCDMADFASDHFERENSLELFIYEQQLLKAIEEALGRIKEGTYGRCAVCSSPISTQRLLAVPNANLCIRCQEEKERNGVPSKILKARR